MKPKERKPGIIYRVVDIEKGTFCQAYSRAYCYEVDFESAEEARSSLFNDEYQDREKYKIAKYRVTYELVDDDCDAVEDRNGNG